MDKQFKPGNSVIWLKSDNRCKDGVCVGKVARSYESGIIVVSWDNMCENHKRDAQVIRVNSNHLDIADESHTVTESDNSDVMLYSNQYRNPLNVGDSVIWGNMHSKCEGGHCTGIVTKADKGIVTVIKTDTVVEWDKKCEAHKTFDSVEDLHSSRLALKSDTTDIQVVVDKGWHEGLSAEDVRMRQIDTMRLLVGESVEIPGFYIKLDILAEGVHADNKAWRVVLTRVTDIATTYFTVHNTCVMDRNGEAEIHTEMSSNFMTREMASYEFMLRCFNAE